VLLAALVAGPAAILVGAPPADACDLWPKWCAGTGDPCADCRCNAQAYRDWALCYCEYLKRIPALYARCRGEVERHYQYRLLDCLANACNG